MKQEKKISKANKGKKKPKDFGEKVSEARQGMKFTEEHKENISKNRKVYTEEQLDKVVELHEQGLSSRKIEEITGVGRATVNRHLKKIKESVA